MKSGLEDRNNVNFTASFLYLIHVSMKSGLEDRNNPSVYPIVSRASSSLNEVRPGRPEQSHDIWGMITSDYMSQ